MSRNTNRAAKLRSFQQAIRNINAHPTSAPFDSIKHTLWRWQSQTTLQVPDRHWTFYTVTSSFIVTLYTCCYSIEITLYIYFSLILHHFCNTVTLTFHCILVCMWQLQLCESSAKTLSWEMNKNKSSNGVRWSHELLFFIRIVMVLGT